VTGNDGKPQELKNQIGPGSGAARFRNAFGHYSGMGRLFKPVSDGRARLMIESRFIGNRTRLTDLLLNYITLSCKQEGVIFVTSSSVYFSIQNLNILAS